MTSKPTASKASKSDDTAERVLTGHTTGDAVLVDWRDGRQPVTAVVMRRVGHTLHLRFKGEAKNREFQLESEPRGLWYLSIFYDGAATVAGVGPGLRQICEISRVLDPLRGNRAQFRAPKLTKRARNVLIDLRDNDGVCRWRPYGASQWGLAKRLHDRELLMLDPRTGICTITSRGRAALDKTS